MMATRTRMDTHTRTRRINSTAAPRDRRRVRTISNMGNERTMS